MNFVPPFTAAIVLLTSRLPPEALAIAMLVVVMAGTLLLLGAGFLVRWASHRLMGVSADSLNRKWFFFKWAVLVSGGVAWLALTIAAINAPAGPSPETVAIARLRTINTAEVTYLAAHNGNYGALPDLISAGLLDSYFDGHVSGYFYNVATDGSYYTATAFPASAAAGKYGYYSWPDAVVRYAGATTATCMPCYPSGGANQPVQ